MTAIPVASMRRTLLLAVLAALALTGSLPAHAAAPQTHANKPTEVVLQAARDHADPFNTLSVDAVFTDPSGPAGQPDYRHYRSYAPSEEVPLVIEGREVGRLAASAMLA